MSLLCITRVETLSHRACSLNHWLLMLKSSSLTSKWSYRIQANEIFLPLLTLSPQGNRTASTTSRSWGGGVAMQAGFGSSKKSGSKGKEEEEKTVAGRSNSERGEHKSKCTNRWGVGVGAETEWNELGTTTWSQTIFLPLMKLAPPWWDAAASHAIIAQQLPSRRSELKSRAQISHDLIHDTHVLAHKCVASLQKEKSTR